MVILTLYYNYGTAFLNESKCYASQYRCRIWAAKYFDMSMLSARTYCVSEKCCPLDREYFRMKQRYPRNLTRLNVLV